jgi:fused signal recognition particle receptor
MNAVKVGEGMWSKIQGGLEKALAKTAQGWRHLWKATDTETVDWDAIEEEFLMADIGYAMSQRLIAELKKAHGRGLNIQEHMRTWIADMMKPYENHQWLQSDVIMFVGVNGSGKTTLLGKIAGALKAQGKRVRVIGADTYRAAAKEQLSQWVGDSLMDIPHQEPSAAVFHGLMASPIQINEVVLIDTAGRLNNRDDLMQQMKKTHDTMVKCTPNKKAVVVMVLDGTVGQHARHQYEAFAKVMPIFGVMINKLDGTARGGALLELAVEGKVTLCATGFGEKEKDWDVFCAQSFAQALTGGVPKDTEKSH